MGKKADFRNWSYQESNSGTPPPAPTTVYAIKRLSSIKSHQHMHILYYLQPSRKNLIQNQNHLTVSSHDSILFVILKIFLKAIVAKIPSPEMRLDMLEYWGRRQIVVLFMNLYDAPPARLQNINCSEDLLPMDL